jgi:C4-dicarboxylate-specific signal transduction histidine kinase
MQTDDELKRLVEDVRRILEGDASHRVAQVSSPDLDEIRECVNRLADRMVEDRERLASNIRSLDETNRELRAARDQVVRSARLASAGTLAAGIAHEVGNPLGAIMGFTDVARARAKRAGQDTDLLDSVREEARRIDRIVRGLLDYARPSGSEQDSATAGEVVARVRDLLDSQGRLTGVETRWTLDGGSDHVLLRPRRLEQVLVNLLLNALHAIREVEDPQILIRLSEAEGRIIGMPNRREDDLPELNYMHRRRKAADAEGVGSVATAERVTVIEVADNGPGIPEDMVEHLFDPFFTTKDPGEGTGLGLSICARLIEGMGGTIEFEQGDSVGARFVIRLPTMYDVGDGFLDSDSTETQ